LTARKAGLWITAVFFMAAGFLHLVRPAPFLKIVPPWIPMPAAAVLVSGLAEIAGGFGLLIPRLRRPAAWGLAALLIAVFPANVYMATGNIQMTRTPLPSAFLWARLALQPPLIWWVLRFRYHKD